MFDEAFYLDRNPEVEFGNISSLHDYLICGAEAGRDPSASFDTDWYIEQNIEVIPAGWNPLVHYVRRGLAEGRRPRPPHQARKETTIDRKLSRARIVFISGEPNTPGHRYRVENLCRFSRAAFFSKA